MGFKLEAAGIRMELVLAEIERLHIHEEIIPKSLEDLVRAIKEDNVAKHPIIVDGETFVVLDGTHRVAAFEELGCDYIPSCLVDYEDPKIGLGCWYRTVRGGIGVPELLSLLQSMGLEMDEVPVPEAEESLKCRKGAAAILFGERCYLLGGKAGDVWEAYKLVKLIENALVGRGLKIGYETERDAESKLRAGEVDAVLMTPIVTKVDVLEVALSGRVFVHKTTRHVIPARPMGINVPLSWLVGKRPREEIDRLLIEHLSKRNVKRMPKGSIFEGRRYEEELLIFE